MGKYQGYRLDASRRSGVASTVFTALEPGSLVESHWISQMNSFENSMVLHVAPSYAVEHS